VLEGRDTFVLMQQEEANRFVTAAGSYERGNCHCHLASYCAHEEPGGCMRNFSTMMMCPFLNSSSQNPKVPGLKRCFIREAKLLYVAPNPLQGREYDF